MTLPAGLFAGTAHRVRKALQGGTELGKIQQQALENPLDFAAPMGTLGPLIRKVGGRGFPMLVPSARKILGADDVEGIAALDRTDRAIPGVRGALTDPERAMQNRGMTELYADIMAGGKPGAGHVARMQAEVDPEEMMHLLHPASEQPDAVRRLMKEYGFGPHETPERLTRRMQKDVNQGVDFGEVDRETRHAILRNRLKGAGVQGVNRGQSEVTILDPARLRFIENLERLAAMGLSGEGLRQMVAKAKSKPQQPQQQSQQQPRTPGGW